MMNRHPLELLGPYADGELPPEEMARVAQHLQGCTECGRELSLIRSMGEAMRGMVTNTRGRGIWDSVHARISRPVGWILFAAGVAVWVTMAGREWFRNREITWEWLGSSAVWIGLALIAVGVGYEQYREWKETRYKDVHQ
jgi:anti-sigma factor RsiW